MNPKLIEISATKPDERLAQPETSCSPEYLAILIGPPSSLTSRLPVMIWLDAGDHHADDAAAFA